MNKVDLQKINLAPPREWLAVHKETGKCYPVVGLTWWDGKLVQIEVLTGVLGKTRRVIRGENFYLCGSTGYIDSEKSRVFGGHIIKWSDDDEPFVIVWDKKKREWWCKSLHVDYVDDPLNDFCIENCTIIAHIHQPNEWPDEVRELLNAVSV